MNKYSFSILIFTVLIALSTAAFAQGKKIYTWTDENGVTHYVDTPPDNTAAVSMDAPEAYRPGTAGPDSDDQFRDDIPTAEDDPTKSYADQKREEIAKNRAEKNAEQAEMTAVCQSAQRELEKIEPSRRVFYTNEDGVRTRLDDVERTDRVAELKAIIAQYCK